ncbi:hypothetical protein [Klebsiella pneumoniae]|uniref:hypothetical protein n=1 Tax=Klebsiella pneumoniae TaxID=573 RepID=UPI001D183BC1|nr:hypothetical protein [Klebsiella pneumoniae]
MVKNNAMCFLPVPILNKSEMIPTLLGSITPPKLYDKNDIDLILDKAGAEEDDVEIGVIPPDQRASTI